MTPAAFPHPRPDSAGATPRLVGAGTREAGGRGPAAATAGAQAQSSSGRTPHAFTGFRPGSRQTPVPSAFFTQLLPFIDDLTELKVTLFLLHRLTLKKGYPRFVTLQELHSDLDLLSSLAHEGDPGEALAQGLEAAVARGTFLRLALERPQSVEHLYFMNTDTDRRAIASIQRGEVQLGGLPRAEPPPAAPERRDIYTLYEENIGALSPLVAEELKEAEQTYPYEWIVEAFREAARLNRRSWRYVQRILERWQAEGRSRGDPQGHPEEIRRRKRPGTGPGGGYLVGGPRE